ncbi:MAG: VWA domain-containing protein [Deltaproteobacteria bacterium]|nr:VWA domain-containing protein [Deltaproteobacteria bacterium]
MKPAYWFCRALGPAVLSFALLGADAAHAIGILVPTQPGIPALRLLNHRVEVVVTERGARTKVTQEFLNPTGQQLEATYLFPLPKGATVDEYALWMNGKREIGKVMERGRARSIYESIVRRARDPGLIEYVDGEMFQARVFPIPARGRQRVELIYSHLVDYEAGVHRYLYPMKTDAMAATTLEDFTLTVDVKNKLPIRNLYSPTHRVGTRTRGTQAWASMEKNGFSLADDFILYWSVDDKDVGLTVLTYKDEAEPGYFMLLASPRDDFRDREIIGKRVSFVIDISGSMAGQKIQAAKQALDYCVSKLGEDDLFNVIPFGSYVEKFSDKMVAASRDNVQKARAFVQQIEAVGGTNIDEAFQAAFDGVSGSSQAPHIVVFMTDGRPTVGETDVTKLLASVQGRNRDSARIFVFGVGEDLNTVLLDKLADNNGGRASYLKGDASLQQEVTAFYDRISYPVLSGLKLEVNGVSIFGTHPRTLPGLFRGSQLVLLGRYRNAGRASVTLTGQSGRGQRSFSYSADFAASGTEHKFIPRLWAQRQVGMLLGEIRDKGETPGLVDEVTQLATAFGIITPYTSYLVVEPTMQQPRPELVRRGLDDMIPSRPRGGPVREEERSVFAPAPAEAEADMAFAPPSAAAPSASGGFAKGEGRVARPKKDSKARDSLRTATGETAVAAAREIGRLQDATVATARQAPTAVVRALGRKFKFDSGYYVDEKSRADDKTLTIKAYSDAYFMVLRLRPGLKDALKLGEKIKVNVGKGRTLIIASEGKEKIAEGELKSFLAK